MTPGSSELLAARTTDPRLAGATLIITSARPEFFEGADVYLRERFTLDDLLAALARCEERARARSRRSSPGRDLDVDAASEG